MTKGLKTRSSTQYSIYKYVYTTYYKNNYKIAWST